jgi:hypothetical protein
MLIVAPEEATRSQLEEAVTQWRNTREVRLAVEKEAALLKKEEDEIKNFIIAVSRAQKYEAVVIGGRMTSVTTKEQAICEDRPAFCKYILDNDALDLLQFRVSESAIKERVEAGIEVPGIGYIDVYQLSDKKA